MSQILYLPEIIEQVSQIVFLAYFTVLGLFTTMKRKMSQNLYLREFCEQVLQIVFLPIRPFFVLPQLYEQNYNKTDIFVSSVYKYHRSCS